MRSETSYSLEQHVARVNVALSRTKRLLNGVSAVSHYDYKPVIVVIDRAQKSLEVLRDALSKDIK